MYPALNLPRAELSIRLSDQKPVVFDVCRRKYVRLTPEEWVRQNMLHYLIDNLNYPKGMVATECSLTFNGMSRRADIVAFGAPSRPLLIVECKAPGVAVGGRTVEQALRYNVQLGPACVAVTNGLTHFCLLASGAGLTKLDHIPDWAELNALGRRASMACDE